MEVKGYGQTGIDSPIHITSVFRETELSECGLTLPIQLDKYEMRRRLKQGLPWCQECYTEASKLAYG